MKWILKWIAPAWSQIALLAVGAFGVLAIYGKGKKDQKTKIEIQDLKNQVEAVERLNDVETSANRNKSLDRLRKSGRVRED